jgi:hypothetical protein
MIPIAVVGTEKTSRIFSEAHQPSEPLRIASSLGNDILKPRHRLPSWPVLPTWPFGPGGQQPGQGLLDQQVDLRTSSSNAQLFRL